MPKQAIAKITEISTSLSGLPDDLLDEIFNYISPDTLPMFRLIDQHFNEVVLANLFPRLSSELQTQWLIKSLTLDNSRLPTKTIKTILSNLQQTHYLLPERFTILLALAKNLDIKVTLPAKIIEQIFEQIIEKLRPNNRLSDTVLYLSIFLAPKPDGKQCHRLLTTFIETLESNIASWDLTIESISPLIPLQSLILELEGEQCDNLLASAKEKLKKEAGSKNEIAAFTLTALTPRLNTEQLNDLFNFIPTCINSCWPNTGLDEALAALIPKFSHTQRATLLNSLIQKEDAPLNRTRLAAVAYTLEALIPELDVIQARQHSARIIEKLLDDRVYIRNSIRRTLNALAAKLSTSQRYRLLAEGFTILQNTYEKLLQRSLTYGAYWEQLDVALSMLLKTHLLAQDTALLKNLLTEQVEKLKTYEERNTVRVLIALIPHLNIELRTHLLTQLTAICDNCDAKAVIKALQNPTVHKVARPSYTAMATNNIASDKESIQLLPIFIKKLTEGGENSGAGLEQLILKLEASQCAPLINTLVAMLDTSSVNVAAHFLGFLIVTGKCDIKTLSAMPEVRNSFLGEIIYQMAELFDSIQSKLAISAHSYGFFNRQQEVNRSYSPENTVAMINHHNRSKR